MTDPDPKSRKVTVCGKCFTASCWHGVFMCDASRTAPTVDRTVAELDAMGREHPSNYTTERVLEMTTGRGGCMAPRPPADPADRLRKLVEGLPASLRQLYLDDTTFNALLHLAARSGWSERLLLITAVEYLGREKHEAAEAFAKLHAEGCPPIVLQGDGTVLVFKPEGR